MIIKRVCLSVYVSFSMTGRGFSNIHTCSRVFFSEFYYNLTWRFLDRGSVLFDFFSLDKPVCPKTPLPVMLFWHTRFKNQRKRYPWRGIVMLSYIVSAQIDAVSMYVCFIFMIKHMVFRHTYIERKRFAPSRKSRAKRVCFKTPLACRRFWTLFPTRHSQPHA